MKGTADTAALTQEARDVPIPGNGGVSPTEGGDLQKGVQDTCGFLYPLLRHPLIFRRPRLPAVARLKAGTAIKTALSSTALRRRFGMASPVICRA